MRNTFGIFIGLFLSSTVLAAKAKPKHGAEVFVENSFGLNPGVAYFYNIPQKPWMVGVKYRHIQTESKDIGISGGMLGVDVHRYLWSKSRLQLWGTSELGMIKYKLDLSDVNPVEKDIDETAWYVALGAEGRYNATNRLRIVLGVGVMVSTIDNEFRGEVADYEINQKPIQPTMKVGLLYYF